MHLFDNKAFSFFQCDVRNLGELPKDTTHIIHAAATSNRNDFASFPATAAENNINATSRIFRLSQGLSSLENILYLSSGLVYGRHLLNGPDLDENSFESSGTPFNSKNAYIESKRMSESFAAAFISESRLPIMVARPFAFVGPYQSLNLPWAITDFIRDCFQGGPVKIMGDGSHIRSIMYASDFANYVLNISANAKSRSVYNIGSDEAIDLVSLAKLISAQFKDAPQIITSVSNSFVKPDRLVPSLKKIQEDLGLHSSFNLKETISRAVNWYQLTHKE